MRLAELAERQHGVVALSQLRDLGLTASAVRSRVAAGRLHPVHRGVYAVGRPGLNGDGRSMAAVLACGPGAVLSHRSAAAQAALIRSDRAIIDVTVPTRAGRTRAGIEIHRGDLLRPGHVTAVDGIPCTTVARTLLDLAEVSNRRLLERAVEQAEALRVFDGRAVSAVLAEAGGRRRGALLADVVAAAVEPTITRSELEQRFLALCRRAGLPRPAVNVWLPLDRGGVEVDFVWRSERLIVETDGYAVHGTAAAFERDRRRDQRLARAGWRVLRFTWRQVVYEPDEVIRTLAALLASDPLMPV